MNFKVRGSMQSSPECTMEASVAPVGFEGSLTGSFEGQVGALSAEIGQVPLRFAVPFLKRGGKLPVVAVVGGFTVKLAPFRVKVEGAGLKAEGVFGTKGIEGKMHCTVACKTDLKAGGRLCGKIGLSHLDFRGGEEGDDESRCD